jgi:hypothetical protein
VSAVFIIFSGRAGRISWQLDNGVLRRVCQGCSLSERRILMSSLLLLKLRGLSPPARTIPTERPPLVGEVSADFSG